MSGRANVLPNVLEYINYELCVIKLSVFMSSFHACTLRICELCQAVYVTLSPPNDFHRSVFNLLKI